MSPDGSELVPVPDDTLLFVQTTYHLLDAVAAVRLGRFTVRQHTGNTYAFVEFDQDDAYGTDDDVLVLGGEGILGLEAAMASLLDRRTWRITA